MFFFLGMGRITLLAALSCVVVARSLAFPLQGQHSRAPLPTKLTQGSSVNQIQSSSSPFSLYSSERILEPVTESRKSTPSRNRHNLIGVTPKNILSPSAASNSPYLDEVVSTKNPNAVTVPDQATQSRNDQDLKSVITIKTPKPSGLVKRTGSWNRMKEELAANNIFSNRSGYLRIRGGFLSFRSSNKIRARSFCPPGVWTCLNRARIHRRKPKGRPAKEFKKT